MVKVAQTARDREVWVLVLFPWGKAFYSSRVSVIKELSTKSLIIHTSEIKTGEILTYNHVLALTEL